MRDLIGQSSPRSTDGQELHCGVLSMIQKVDNRTCKVPVTMKLYKKSYGLYAVVSPDKAYTNKSIYVNLRNGCVRQTNDNEFIVVTNNTEGHMVTFQTRSKHETEIWINMLQNNTGKSQRSNRKSLPSGRSLLPSVQESHADECDSHPTDGPPKAVKTVCVHDIAEE